MTLLTEGQTTFPFGVQQCEEFFLNNDSSVGKKEWLQHIKMIIIYTKIPQYIEHKFRNKGL